MNKLVAQTLAKKENGEKGFTLIELLVVVIIIGILAAIAIPVFLNMRQGAWRSSVEADVSNAALALETVAASNNGSVPDTLSDDYVAGANDLDTGAATLTVSPGNTITVLVGTDGDSYTITGSNENLPDTQTFEYESDGSGEGWSE